MENTGHAYNSLGKLKEAEESFLESLKLADMPGASVRAKSNRGGVLLGLGLVKDRLGNTKEGLKVLYEALEFYKQRFQGVDHSLIAKTLMSIGHTHEKLREFSKAEESFREAMRIFKATCGDDTPLTANAVHSLAKIVKKDNDRFEECRQLLLESLSAYVSFDTLHVYLNIICEIATAVVRLQVAASKQDQKSGGNSLQTLNAVFKPFVAPVLKCRKRIIQNSIDDGQGTVAVFYKTSGEILMLSGMYVDAVKVLSDATDLLEKITILDVSHLVNECKSMSAFATSQIAIHSIK